jgi:hypothetical protein
MHRLCACRPRRRSHGLPPIRLARSLERTAHDRYLNAELVVEMRIERRNADHEGGTALPIASSIASLFHLQGHAGKTFREGRVGSAFATPQARPAHFVGRSAHDVPPACRAREPEPQPTFGVRKYQANESAACTAFRQRATSRPLA